jgi:cell division protein FtsW (lipid II flippase)
VGSSVLFTLLLFMPFLLGVHYSYWLIGLALGTVLGVYFYVRRGRYAEPGSDADETRFPR